MRELEEALGGVRYKRSTKVDRICKLMHANFLLLFLKHQKVKIICFNKICICHQFAAVRKD